MRSGKYPRVSSCDLETKKLQMELFASATTGRHLSAVRYCPVVNDARQVKQLLIYNNDYS
jgi:hypothetical protein